MSEKKSKKVIKNKQSDAESDEEVALKSSKKKPEVDSEEEKPEKRKNIEVKEDEVIIDVMNKFKS